MGRIKSIMATVFTFALIVSSGCGGGSSSTATSETVPPSSPLTLSSTAFDNDGTLPVDYTYDGSGASPDLSWSNPPTGTVSFVLLMTTIALDGTKWNWILYDIPSEVTGLARNTSGVGTGGMNTHLVTTYAPPQSTGPGDKVYTFTLYALSASPDLPDNPALVTGAVITEAIEDLVLGSASLDVTYARQAPVADFTWQASGLAVTFSDNSGLSTASRLWDFGDDATSTATDPVHTYATAGSYTVTLTATNGFGSDDVVETVTVGVD